MIFQALGIAFFAVLLILGLGWLGLAIGGGFQGRFPWEKPDGSREFYDNSSGPVPRPPDRDV